MDGRLSAQGALDFSWLNQAPAGAHGFLGTKGGHFRFDDGAAIKFWGVNLSSGAAMPDRDAADVIALDAMPLDESRHQLQGVLRTREPLRIHPLSAQGERQAPLPIKEGTAPMGAGINAIYFEIERD